MSVPAAIRRTLAAALAAGAISAGLAASAQAAPPTGDGTGGFSLTQVGSFERPTHAAAAPGTKGNLYVVESEGRIRVLSGTTALPTPFLDISDMVKCCGEEGMLSVAFHPKYKKNRLFYVYFTDNNGDNEVWEFKRSKKRKFVAQRSSGRQVLLLSHPVNGNHNGGQLQFGPDGLLYIAPGDGGGGGDAPNNAQNPSSLLGKVLRINPQKSCSKRFKVKVKAKKKGKRPRFRCRRYDLPYTSPKDNPYAATGGRPEVYAIGLRNPYRFSFDAVTGALSIGDVGQGCREEIDYRTLGTAKGVNFGWSGYEGTRVYNASRVTAGTVFPIHEYDNVAATAPCPELNNGFEGTSVIAGYVVRDERLAHQYGRLLYTDAANDQIHSLIPGQAGATDEQFTGIDLPGNGAPFSFAQGFQNQLFVVSGNGPIYRLDPA